MEIFKFIEFRKLTVLPSCSSEIYQLFVDDRATPYCFTLEKLKESFDVLDFISENF